MKNGARFLALAAVVLLPLTAAGTQADWTAANRALVDGYVIPRYAALALATARLAEEADTFCRTPDAESLEKARDGFHGVMDAWQAVGHLSFGPVELYMRRYRFELWPDKHNTAAKQLRTLLAAENREILTEGAFARASVAIQGLPALESLLFEEGVDASAFGSGRESSYRCELMQAIAGNLAAMATEVLELGRPGRHPFASRCSRPPRVTGTLLPAPRSRSCSYGTCAHLCRRSPISSWRGHSGRTLPRPSQARRILAQRPITA